MKQPLDMFSLGWKIQVHLEISKRIEFNKKLFDLEPTLTHTHTQAPKCLRIPNNINGTESY